MSNKMYLFNPEWNELPQFRDWLVSVVNDKSKAYCRWCASVLRAHKFDLTFHSTSKRHIKNESRGDIPSGPISVQLIANDDDDDDEQDATATRSFPASDREVSGRYGKRYRQEWESIPELKNWLSVCSTDGTKAYCKVCDLQLRAHKHDLLVHGKSAKHKKIMDKLGVTVVEGNCEDGPSRNSVNQGEEAESMVITADFEENGNGSNGGESEDSRDIDQDWTPAVATTPTSPRKPTPKKARLDINTPAKRQRPSAAPRFTASEIVRAIERDDFKGYELLTIVKAAVAKL